MWPKQTQLAFALSFAIFCSSSTHAAASQAKRVSTHSYIRVVSVNEDVSGNFVLLNTLKHQQLARPTIHFLTTSDGISIMTADFDDTILCAPASSFSPPHSQLQRVHIGQLQAAPPIVRLTFETKSPEVFKRIDFRANVGCLTLKLPISKRTYEQPPAKAVADKNHVVPQVVSKILAAPSSTSLHTSQQMPPVADARSKNPRPPVAAAANPPRQNIADARVDPNQPQLRGPIAMTEEQLQATVTDATYERIDSPAQTWRRDAAAPSSSPGTATSSSPSTATSSSPSTATSSSPGTATSSSPSTATSSRRVAKADAQRSPFSGALKRMLGMGAANVSTNQTDDNGSRPSSNPVRTQAAKATPGVARADANAPQPVSPQPAAELRLTTTGRDPLTLQIVANKAVTYKTFRLHEPERLVIDIAGLSSAPKFIPTEIQASHVIRSLRIGSPEGAPEVTRLVADLVDTQIAVSQDAGGKPNSLALTLTRADDTAKTGGPLTVPPNAFVVLDAGHGGHDPGAQRGDIQEKELTLEIVDKLKRILQSKGVRVKLTRADDTFVSLEDRVSITNTAQPNAFVSVHINSMQTDNGARGIETYFQNERSGDLAKLLHQSLVSGLNAPDRSVRKARFYVINHTPLPAVLCEVGFISNKDEREKLASSDYQSHIAEALADGVMLYLAQQKPASGSGTMPDQTASASAQSFTQNLHSKAAREVAQKPSKTPVSSAKKLAESARNTKIESASSTATMQ